MKVSCRTCSTLNPATANFCSNCGTGLVNLCSNCEGELPAGARFCPDCGQLAIAGSSTDQVRLAQLAAATPEPLAEKVRSAQVTGERRIVTCLFADVVGSTMLAEQMDPEEWASIISGAFERLAQAIYRYEGTIARLMGDALLAFFGAPVAHEDDPVRAVRAGLDLVTAAEAYATEVRDAYGLDFAVRIGLSTGPVVVGNISSDLLFDYTALGDSVNLAARMHALARPMTVLISEQTYRFVKPLFDFADLGEIEVKGRRAPARVYEVRGVRAEPGRVRGLQGLRSPLVGRAAELDTLLALSRTVEAGLGRVAVIAGEPGLGKSRLVAEWKASADGAMQWAEGRCLSYGGGLADHLVVDLLRALLGVGPGAAREETQTALRGLVADLFDGEAIDVYPYLADLLSLDLEDEQRDRIRNLDSQELRLKYGAALERLLMSLAARHPLALVLEDIHWADPSSTDLLARLLPLATRAPLLFCLVTRPDRGSAGWKLVDEARSVMGAGLTELMLNPLPELTSYELVSNLLQVKALPAEVRDLILEKAEGNPFFVEEMIRELIERDVIIKKDGHWIIPREVEDVQVPGNLQTLLLSRIDRLPEEAKQTLRVAAVIGRQFSVGTLEEVMAVSPLASHLATLESAGLIRLVAVQPELEYLFQHTLLQEAAYQSLLRKERQQLHLQAGEALEKRYGDRLAELAGTLGHHFEQGKAWQRALEYFERAGNHAKQRHGLHEAAAYYSRALKAAEQVKAPQITLLRARGSVYETLGRFDLAHADHIKALDLAQSIGDRYGEWRALLDLGFLWMARDYDRSGDYFQKALELAQKMDDPRALAESLNRRGNWYINQEELDKGQRCHEEALEIYKQLDDRAGIATTVDLLALVFASIGDAERTAVYYEQAIDGFRELGNWRGLSSSLAMLAAVTYRVQGAAAESRPDIFVMAQEAMDIAHDIDWSAGEAYALEVLSFATTVRGEYDQAFGLAARALQISEEIGHHHWTMVGNYQMGRIYLDLLAFPQAHDYFEHALDLAKRIGSTHWHHVSAVAMSRIYTLQGKLSQAQAILDDTFGPVGADPRALQFAKRLLSQARAELALVRGAPDETFDIVDPLSRAPINQVAGDWGGIPTLMLLRARALVALGRLAEAEAVLRPMQAAAEAHRTYPLLWRVQQSLGHLLHTKGQRDEAASTLVAARTTIEALAAKVPDAALRETFLRNATAQLSPGDADLRAP